MAGKYHNVKVSDGGYTFDSKAEHRRWQELKLLQASGKINNLSVHYPLPLIVGAKVVGKYISDFYYYDYATNQSVIEDVKSVATKTAVYRLKKKMVKAQYGIDITEVQA